MCIRTLFSRPAHSNSLVMELLLICLYSKLADFFRNFTFDSHRDLKLSRTQENVKFKYFSRSMVSFQGLFKTNFVFKDFSRLPFIFKYFSSLCEPCLFIPMDGCCWVVFFFFFFFWFGFYGPFKNISLISSWSFIEGGRKPENPEKNHLTIRKQNLAFHPSQARVICGKAKFCLQARVICGKAKFCLRMVRWFFSKFSGFRPPSMNDRLDISEIFLKGP